MFSHRCAESSGSALHKDVSTGWSVQDTGLTHHSGMTEPNRFSKYMLCLLVGSSQVCLQDICPLILVVVSSFWLCQLTPLHSKC